MSDEIKAGIRFDPDNYVGIDYDKSIPNAKVTIIKNGEIIEPSENYITVEQLMVILGNYVTGSDLTTALGDYITDSDLASELSDYVSDSDLASELSGYVSDSDLASELSGYVSDSDLASELSGYVTDSEFNNFKLGYVDVNLTGTFTIPSSGYLQISDTPPDVGANRAVASMFFNSWGANNGAVALSRGTNNVIYIFGSQGSSITNPSIRVLYYI